MQIAEDKKLIISDRGIPQHLSFDEALAFHKGNSYWGCALAFRVLQSAGTLLSQDRMWDRERLSVVSGHPGPGVRDTFEYVTGCVSRHRFRLSCSTSERRCVRDMQFDWRVADGVRSAHVRLRDDFVPEPFFDLLDRLETEAWKPEDDERLDYYKAKLTRKIWETPLDEAFPGSSVTPLKAG